MCDWSTKCKCAYLKKVHWTLKYFRVLWLKLTVNFITDFEIPAIKMKLVITSPAINVCVLEFWLYSEPYWHWPWHRPWPWPWPWRPSPWPWPWRLWPWLQVCFIVKNYSWPETDHLGDEYVMGVENLAGIQLPYPSACVSWRYISGSKKLNTRGQGSGDKYQGGGDSRLSEHILW